MEDWVIVNSGGFHCTRREAVELADKLLEKAESEGLRGFESLV